MASLDFKTPTKTPTKTPARTPTLECIMSEVAYIYRVEVGNLVSPPARTQEYVFPRYVAMYIAKLYGYRYTALREAFRCSSVYGGPLAISHRIRIDAALRTRIADIMRFLEYQVMQDDDEALS